MKIYTKKGDNGTTELIGGKRVPKNHLRIEAYGTIDELIAFIGVVRDHCENREISDDLLHIQNKLMIAAAILASEGEEYEGVLPKLFDKDIVRLEKRIDRMEEQLPNLTSFVLPGGHRSVSFCHVARTVCRRAERVSMSLYKDAGLQDVVLRYLNRLSDYLFVLSRLLGRQFHADEIPWHSAL
ncbi:MAG: cob(I)yrinic acid a,c-diamide adenosyltransferase [Bacteroidales bacterium]|jgi:cob(I)alamin adenosyltransferase